MSQACAANVIQFENRAGAFRLESQLQRVGVQHKIVSSRIDQARTTPAIIVVIMPLDQTSGLTDALVRSLLSKVRLVVYKGHVYKVRLEEALVAQGGHRPSSPPDYVYIRFGILDGRGAPN